MSQGLFCVVFNDSEGKTTKVYFVHKIFKLFENSFKPSGSNNENGYIILECSKLIKNLMKLD